MKIFLRKILSIFFSRKIFVSLLSTIFVFARCLWRNKHKRCVYVCLFRCAYGAQPTVSKRVVCTFDSFVFFLLCCVVLVCTYIHTYITESARGLTKRQNVKKKSNISTTKPRFLSLCACVCLSLFALSRLTSSSSPFVCYTKSKIAV